MVPGLVAGGFSVGARALGMQASVVVALGSRAQAQKWVAFRLSCPVAWDLPRPDRTHVSALADRF